MPSAPDPGKPAEWRSEAGIVWVYVLRSAVRGTLYIGQTNDLQVSVRKRAAGKKPFLPSTTATQRKNTSAAELPCRLRAASHHPTRATLLLPRINTMVYSLFAIRE